MLKKQRTRISRHKRVRSKIFGVAERPRLNVYRSLKNIFAQLVDDTQGVTIVAANDLKEKGKMNKKERAHVVGKALAEKAKEKGISKCLFDRGGYKYHGRVKSLAEGAREGGLEF
ncbi:MAG TPA: 50S ribosomal protein L18 [Candidatus Peregrinibacteria bacterium]|nr:50S ribosomal protein L18 [Candidatus Peregrinibacteria bacterium]